MITSMMDQITIPKYLPEHKDSPKAQYSNTLLPAKRRDPPLEVGHYTKIGGMWNLKHDIKSPKFYELIIKT